MSMHIKGRSMKPQDPLTDVCSVSFMKLCGSQDLTNFFGQHRRVKAVTLQCTDPLTAGGNIAKGKYHFPAKSGSVAEGQHIASPKSCCGTGTSSQPGSSIDQSEEVKKSREKGWAGA